MTIISIDRKKNIKTLETTHFLLKFNNKDNIYLEFKSKAINTNMQKLEQIFRNMREELTTILHSIDLLSKL